MTVVAKSGRGTTGVGRAAVTLAVRAVRRAGLATEVGATAEITAGVCGDPSLAADRVVRGVSYSSQYYLLPPLLSRFWSVEESNASSEGRFRSILLSELES